MLQLLYTAIFGQMLLILTLLFKTPLRKLIIISLDRLKRGRGPIVVTTVGATLVVVLASSVYSIVKIQNRTVEAGVVNPTDQVLMSKHLLEASLMDRLHHYIRELRMLRKTMEAIKKQSRNVEDGGKNSSNLEEHKALTGEIATLEAQIKKLESECQAKGSKAKDLETEVEALKKQSEGFLMEYDRLVEDNQNIRSQLEAIDHSSSHLDDKKSN